ncbi:LysM peptidoglycan-binding domain-containing protein [Nafulsella turpanensis]|uniref:LysM peptidoglycan-binding domain-containing protein n=1 Tax=Nafulsella turpanensis TaxID=1265690 RepID=UPI001268C8B8|nr:LysM peptidoglycan-binding domain-containing protein [Nafulsella turpanensis]
MKCNRWFILLLMMLTLAAVSPVLAGYSVPGDSVGSEIINGKTFILYKVEPKETLYAISNKYNVSVEELVKYNPETEAGLKVGAILRVPYVLHAPVEEKYHIVTKSETLYSIGRQYNVTVDQLKEWNNLTTDAINLGDRLLVAAPATNAGTSRTSANTAAGEPKNNALDYAGKIIHTVQSQETLYSISRLFDTTEEQLKEWNNLATNNLAIGQKLIVGISKGIAGKEEERLIRNGKKEEAPTDYQYNRNPVTISQIGDPSQTELKDATADRTSVRKMTELGMAMVITDSINTKKYLALHRTAPIGTIMQVHNEMNNLSVFVRVVGVLPPTGANDKVLIMLSQKAFEKLGAYNDKFPVRLTYVP